MWTLIISIIFMVSNQGLSIGIDITPRKLPVLMPNVQPVENDIYLCISIPMSRREPEYIIEFEPKVDMDSIHHILIFSCIEPGFYLRDSPQAIWECHNKMVQRNQYKSSYRTAPPCKKGIKFIYDWSMSATKVVLPEGVGFKAGKGTDAPFIVMQVHYSNVDRFIAGGRDQSGIILSILPGTTKAVTKRASMVVLGSTGTIPANSTERFETSCKVKQPIEMHPFAYQPHTHKLGTLVSGWIIQDGQWKLMGKKDPQEPQIFYPIEDQSLVIRENDTLAARCTYNNYLPYPVSVGSAVDNEMCNFYLMYWVEGDNLFDKIDCWTKGAPTYYWSTDPNIQVPPNIDREASSLV